MKIKLLGHQGDVAIYEIDSFPDAQKVVDSQVKEKTLAYGEVTGHAHYFAEPETVDMFKVDSSEFTGLCFFEVGTDNKLIHGRARNFTGTEPDQDYHNVINLTPGRKYMTGIFQETDWIAKVSRKVID